MSFDRHSPYQLMISSGECRIMLRFVRGITIWNIQHDRLFCRNFLQSQWCLYEFQQAYLLVMEGKINYLIIVLLEDVPRDAMSPELRAYLKTHTYLDARNYDINMATVRKQLRFSMPKIPLKELQVKKY